MNTIHDTLHYLEDNLKRLALYIKYMLVSLIILLGIFVVLSTCRAETIDIERLANAIYRAEGGANTKHPYGILGHWHKPARVICINTIKHALKDFNGKGDFISFLGSRYCPVGCSNDNGTNRFCIKNVKYYYERGKNE
jgi:hypothetical protein